MQSKVDQSARTKMQELRLICDKEIPIQQQKIDSAVLSFRRSLETLQSKAHKTVENQVKLGKLKAQLREVEDDLVKALAVKTRKEAKKMAIMDSISATKAKIEELKRIVEEHKARKDQCAAIISQQDIALATYEGKGDQVTGRREEIQEAIAWYNEVLGFQIEGGHGVKFIFTNINSKNPSEEYSFTIRHANDTYTLLDCSPHLNDIKELIHELNRTNGLFKFVRIMREKFQKAAEFGVLPQFTPLHQHSSTISISAPVSSVSTDSRDESPAEKNELQIKHEQTNWHSEKVIHEGGRHAFLSPGSALSLRRSPRFQVRK
ncbi:hypothetical protein AAG906_000685 [Vitis piasezkii]